MEKRQVMMICQALSASLLLLIPVSYYFGFLNLWLLYAITFLTGCCTVFYQVSSSSYLPEIIPSKSLVNANAKFEISNGAAQVTGPGLGGYLVQLLTAPFAILLDGISFLTSFILTCFLPKTKVHELENNQENSLWFDIKEGIKFTFQHKLLRPILISYSLSVLFIGLYQSISVLYMTRTLNLSASHIGIVVGLGNIGFLVGAFISRKLAEKLGIGRMIVNSLGLLAIGFIIIGLAPKTYTLYWLVAGQFILSMGVPIYNVNLVSLRQSVTPKRLLGRVSSVSKVFGRGSVPIGALLGGFIASVVDPRFAVIIAGVGGLLALSPALFSHVYKLKSIEDAHNYK